MIFENLPTHHLINFNQSNCSNNKKREKLRPDFFLKMCAFVQKLRITLKKNQEKKSDNVYIYFQPKFDAIPCSKSNKIKIKNRNKLSLS
jgi:hypothetical protein